MRKESGQTKHERAKKTRLAIREVRRYLEGAEKDLSHMSKKFSSKPDVTSGTAFPLK